MSDSSTRGITIKDFFKSTEESSNEIRFCNGTVWTLDTVSEKLSAQGSAMGTMIQETPGNDILTRMVGQRASLMESARSGYSTSGTGGAALCNVFAYKTAGLLQKPRVAVIAQPAP